MKKLNEITEREHVKKTWQDIIYEHDDIFDMENFKLFRKSELKKHTRKLRDAMLQTEGSSDLKDIRETKDSQTTTLRESQDPKVVVKERKESKDKEISIPQTSSAAHRTSLSELTPFNIRTTSQMLQYDGYRLTKLVNCLNHSLLKKLWKILRLRSYLQRELTIHFREALQERYSKTELKVRELELKILYLILQKSNNAMLK